MIPLQLSICITEELFAKYLYCYPDTHGNQITCQLSQSKMYCKWYVDWDMHSDEFVDNVVVYLLPCLEILINIIICLFLFISLVDLVFVLFGRINGLFC